MQRTEVRAGLSSFREEFADGPGLHLEEVVGVNHAAARKGLIQRICAHALRQGYTRPAEKAAAVDDMPKVSKIGRAKKVEQLQFLIEQHRARAPDGWRQGDGAP